MVRSFQASVVTLAYVEACGGDRDAWVARWHALVAELAPPPADDGSGAPYVGLSAYEAEDAERFFGRDREIGELCGLLARPGLLAVFAPSGTGKSSLLRAGLLPALANDAVPDSRDWLSVLLTPGEHPVEAFRSRLAAAGVEPDPSPNGTAAGVLVVVDQLEEVFTLCRDEAERSEFIGLLLAFAGRPQARVVLGIRADFYTRCAAYPGLVAALNGRQFLVGPMGPEDLRQVVIGPAGVGGLTVEPALAEVAVAEASGQPGALPLLSHALLETWRRRRGMRLTLADYRASGGVRAAIAETAERVYGEFDAAGQRLVRDVFLRLTALGEGTEDTRRRAAPSELLGMGVRAVSGVLHVLAGARLITVDADGVTVAHEALIQEWPRLRGWLSEDRERLRTLRRLTEAAAEWDRYGRDEGYLYRGARLAAWEGSAVDQLNDVESAFLAASRAREARDRRVARRRTRLAIAALGTTLVVVTALAGVALVQAERADDERDLALSRQLVADARIRLESDPEAALRLARRAFALRRTPEAELVLRQAVVNYKVRSTVPLGVAKAFGVAFSPDGRRLAATGVNGAVRVWPFDGDAVSGPPVVLHGHDGPVWHPVFSPDGTRLATAGADGSVRIWPSDGGRDPVVLRGHVGPAWAVAFSPDGRLVASASDDRTIRIWDVAGTAEPRVLRGHTGVTDGVTFSPDGQSVASGSHDRTAWCARPATWSGPWRSAPTAPGWRAVAATARCGSGTPPAPPSRGS